MAFKRSAAQLMRARIAPQRTLCNPSAFSITSRQSTFSKSRSPSAGASLQLSVRLYSSSSSSSSSSSPPSSPSPSESSSSSYSAAESDSEGFVKPYDFASVKAAFETPSPERVLVDVREPGELQQTGRIPGAVNMPINSAPDGLFLSADEFEDRFGFAKPAGSQELVFYCKAGVRSRAAARVARMAGYENVGEYPGSWVDWEKNGGATEK